MRRIADILGSLDEKIEINRKKIAKLEALAKLIYDYWFVQFDFPDKNGRPYKSSGGKMVWNEKLKREIPEGWEVNALGDITQKPESGKRPKGGINKKLKSGIPSLGAECISDLGDYDFSSTPFLPSEYKRKITSGIIESNDILIYKDGAYVGKCTLFKDDFPFSFAVVNEHVFLLRAIIQNMQEYLLFTLKQPQYFEVMQNWGKAKAAQPGLNQNDLSKINILVPGGELLTRFANYAGTFMSNLFSSAKENAELTYIRDWLLPMLMNGQVEVLG